ncbi:MetQ/NlpA family ABC transporter substrate-binding protein [Paenibacillus mucilaginosus]|uniref:Lipoprotein n=2 Tax=Paenibacillus mucilaginosus TaxID=61624 RepID=H6NC71_9BACL|nr:MetQ/NlpA family ABC transporter substrate-binding protein [Paenibacillus mucilaginosus]AEI42005.1 methionine ABC transporter substrate binding protein precursor [Paenibacillus mucilaginosus KNP414]AFC28264.1 methionine ABC transporter substrate binding protein [Paenibacillus mucilaginosus 3016]MCG7217469.1 MetQ/NlpA family ABC transporter substrate-binding protein [Paenibacillus mucilaginosus]WDM28902.1 MetQ/NlpA family ABC transporter substrate-binding protein [Paenibacillus mucilaginosus]
MKKPLTLALSLVMAFSLAACGTKPAEQAAPAPSNGAAPAKEVTLKVGATAVPHAEILNSVKDKLKAEGVNLEVKEFTDYVQPNVQVFEKQLDANFFQHTPYLDDQNKAKGMNLVKVTGVHIEPFGAYSQKIKKADELQDGATVAIPNDPSNSGRALALLEKNGLIKLKDGAGISGTVKDIVENKKNLKIKELEAAMLPRVLPEVDLALINTNYALEAKLNPTKDALFIEDSNSPYVNNLVSRPDNKDSEAMQKLAKALNSPEVRKFIEDKYQGAVVPAFK